MNNNLLLSLCIPTNGVVDWIIPVLQSIYSQDCDEELFEVVITDNGKDSLLKFEVEKFLLTHKNLIYAKTTAKGFLNQIEAFKYAQGKFIKFINHRAVQNKGTIQYYLDLAKQNESEKPLIYFTNGYLRGPKRINCDSFNNFVKELNIWASWSGGVAIWKTDFDNLSSRLLKYNTLFPHIDFVLQLTNKKSYIIDNVELSYELKIGKTPKGAYNFFYAFLVEFLFLILSLVQTGKITLSTFLSVKRKILKFCLDNYVELKLFKNNTSYDLSNINSSIKVFFPVTLFYILLPLFVLKKILGEGVRLIKRIISPKKNNG